MSARDDYPLDQLHANARTYDEIDRMYDEIDRLRAELAAVPRRITCPWCGGSGHQTVAGDTEDCSACQADGYFDPGDYSYDEAVKLAAQ